jgi:hypothetical protein
MMIPAWVIASMVSGCITLGFGAGIFTAKFVSKAECEKRQEFIANKIAEIFDRMENLRVEFAKHAH